MNIKRRNSLWIACVIGCNAKIQRIARRFVLDEGQSEKSVKVYGIHNLKFIV